MFFGVAQLPKQCNSAMYPPYIPCAAADDVLLQSAAAAAVCGASADKRVDGDSRLAPLSPPSPEDRNETYRDRWSDCRDRWSDCRGNDLYEENGPEAKRQLIDNDTDDDETATDVTLITARAQQDAATWEDCNNRMTRSVIPAGTDAVTVRDCTTANAGMSSAGSRNNIGTAMPTVAANNTDETYDAAAAKFDEYTRGLTAAGKAKTLTGDGGDGSKANQLLLVAQQQSRRHSMTMPYQCGPLANVPSSDYRVPPMFWMRRPCYSDDAMAVDSTSSSSIINGDASAVHEPSLSIDYRASISLANAQRQLLSSCGGRRPPSPSPPFQQQQRLQAGGDGCQQQKTTVGPAIGVASEHRSQTSSRSPTLSSVPMVTNQPVSSLSIGCSGNSQMGWSPGAASRDGSRSGAVFDVETMMKMMLHMTSSKPAAPIAMATSTSAAASIPARSRSPANISATVIDKDEAYRERRRKNNEAAKRSRDFRRQKERSVAQKAEELKVENVELRAQILVLTREVHNLQALLMQQRLIADSISSSKLNSSGNSEGGSSGCGSCGGSDGSGRTGIGIMA